MSRTTLDQLLSKYPADVQALAISARKFILDTLPKADESLDESAGVLGYGYGPGYKGLICTLILSKSGVKLGLAHGAELPDPDRLLAGTGKVHRYVQLRATSDIKKPGVARLLKAARAAWQERLG
jgi:hypothetical protein